jgi:hypothetical protein
MDAHMHPLSVQMTQWKEDLYFAVMFACNMLSTYFAEVTLTAGMVFMLAHLINLVWKVRLFRPRDMRMVIHSEDGTFYTTHYKEGILKYVKNE